MSRLEPTTRAEDETRPTLGGEPGLAEFTSALEEHVDRHGEVSPGIAEALRVERGWRGRVIDILEIFSQSEELLGYMAGGRRPDEVITWLAIWAESSLSLDQIRLIAEAGGWSPEPFVVLARAGLLEALLRVPDGSIRRCRGERVGGWVSDELTTADDATVVGAARDLIERDGDAPTTGSSAPRPGQS